MGYLVVMGPPPSVPPRSGHSRDPVRDMPSGSEGHVPGSGRRRRISERARTGGTRLGERRSPRPLLLAAGIHVVVVAGLLQWLTFGHGVRSWFRFGDEPEREERLTWIETPTTPRSVADALAIEATPVAEPAQPLVPAAEPAAGAPARQGNPSVPVGDTVGGNRPGTGIGALDPQVRGMRPRYEDERVWRGFGGGDGTAGAGRVRGDRADGLDSIMASAIMAARDSLDSLARAQGRSGRAPGDWTTTDRNGNKWGWDQQGIRLGKVMIPNALLSLLPLNAATAANLSGNMSRMDADRRLAASREDIQRMSERTLGEAEFRRVLQEMEKRRDSDRRDRLRAPSASLAAPVATPSQVPGKSGGESRRDR